MEPFGGEIVVRALLGAVEILVPTEPDEVIIRRVEATRRWVDSPIRKNAGKAYGASRDHVVDEAQRNFALDAATEHLAQTAYITCPAPGTLVVSPPS